jgi:hypothetical protein
LLAATNDPSPRRVAGGGEEHPLHHPEGSHPLKQPISTFPRSIPGPPLEPAHRLTTIAAGAGTKNKGGLCRCGQWSFVGPTSDAVAEAFQRHLGTAQGVLL